MLLSRGVYDEGGAEPLFSPARAARAAQDTGYAALVVKWKSRRLILFEYARAGSSVRMAADLSGPEPLSLDDSAQSNRAARARSLRASEIFLKEL
jgi:hypothetical protein